MPWRMCHTPQPGAAPGTLACGFSEGSASSEKTGVAWPAMVSVPRDLPTPKGPTNRPGYFPLTSLIRIRTRPFTEGDVKYVTSKYTCEPALVGGPPSP